MSPEVKFILTVIACTLVLVATLLVIHGRHSKLIKELTTRLDEAEKSQTRALGEWSREMSRHMSDSINGLASTTKTLQAQNNEHNMAVAGRHEEHTRSLFDEFKKLIREKTAFHEEALRILAEQHRRNLEKLAERNELSNEELARQYKDVLATLRNTLEELDARLASGEQTDRELNQSLKALRETLESAVKL